MKLQALAAGSAMIGAGASTFALATLPTSAERDTRNKAGESVMSATDAIAKVAMPTAFFGAMVYAGCRSTSTAGGFTTVMLAGGAAATGTLLSTLVNSSSNSEPYLGAVGIGVPVALAGFALGRKLSPGHQQVTKGIALATFAGGTAAAVPVGATWYARDLAKLPDSV